MTTDGFNRMKFEKGDIVNITLNSGEQLVGKTIMHSVAYETPERKKYLTGEVISAESPYVAYLATKSEYEKGLSTTGVMSVLLDNVKDVQKTGMKGDTKLLLE